MGPYISSAINPNFYKVGNPPLYLTFSIYPSVHRSICRAPHLRIRTSSDHDFWYTCVKWWYLQMFFFPRFSKFWFLGLLGGKRAKNGPKWQKIISRSISQEPYIILLSFIVHMCKMIISPEAFLFFQNFDILGC